MAELTTATSGYATGSIDTWANLTDDPGGDEVRAAHPNGLGSAIVQIETVLGDGTSLKGSKTDLATRLAVQMSAAGIIVPIGTIDMYGGASAPTGWLLCDGTAVNRTTYVDLFGVIGTSYGTGDGSTTFNLPDMRGRVPAGVGTGSGGGTSGTGLPSGGSALTAVSRGTWKGTENAVNISHTHTLTDPGHLHTYTDATAGGGITTNSGAANGATANTSSNTTGITISTDGVSGTGLNIQPVMGVQFKIKF